VTRWRPLLLLVSLLCLAGRSEAITISLSPVLVTTTPGQPVTLELRVSGLDQETLSGWEVDVLFDETLLSLDSVIFSGNLDGGTAGDSLQEVLSIGGGFNVAELSLLSESELEAIGQVSPLLVATLEFTALAEGSATVVLANADAATGSGGAFPEILLESAQVEIVPEPGTGLLVAGALLALASWRSARDSRRA
jgi:hypothetical protein